MVPLPSGGGLFRRAAKSSIVPAMEPSAALIAVACGLPWLKM